MVDKRSEQDLPQPELTLGIVTISFNQARFLTEAIESVQLADASRLRYVIVDPGSTDGSREIIEANRHRFSSVILEPDRGPSNGLNKGFGNCDADILGYINADDRFLTGALDWVLRYFERHPDVDLISGGARIINAVGEPRFRARMSWNVTLEGIAAGSAVAVQQATFFRRSVFERAGGFSESNRTCWDGELVLDMLLAGARGRVVPKLLGDFRIHADSISGSGRLNEPFAIDQQRLRRKLAEHGVGDGGALRRRVLNIVHRAHPRRRLLEYVLPRGVA